MLLGGRAPQASLHFGEPGAYRALQLVLLLLERLGGEVRALECYLWAAFYSTCTATALGEETILTG